MTTRAFVEEKYADCPKIRERAHTVRRGRNVVGNPKISIIIPAYQIAEFAEETLASVFEQTYTDFEVIVVNDGSPDTAALEAAIEPFADRIIYAVQDNSGASQARNTAICFSNGEWLAFLDGDDVWLPGHLESQVSFAEREGYDMVYCDALLFGEPLFDGDNFMRTSPSSGEVNTVSLIRAECNVITSGTLLRRSWAQRVNMFDIRLQRMQDFDLWFRIAQAGARIGYQTEISVRYRVRAEGLSGSNVDRCSRNIRALEVIRDKYNLDADELRAWESKMLEYEAEHDLEKGKFLLIHGKHAEAYSHLRTANKYYRKPKLAIIAALIKVSPRLALTIFKRFRSAEYSFISTHR